MSHYLIRINLGEYMRYLLLIIITFSFMSFSQEEESREPAPGVIELTVVKVKTNYLQDYLDGL